jgi:hypothetical protein
VSPRPQGLRVCCPKYSGWGLGYVLVDDGGAKVVVFFLCGGKRNMLILTCHPERYRGLVGANFVDLEAIVRGAG